MRIVAFWRMNTTAPRCNYRYRHPTKQNAQAALVLGHTANFCIALTLSHLPLSPTPLPQGARGFVLISAPESRCWWDGVVDPVATDLATLASDILVAETGYVRVEPNLRWITGG
jgi:hypothetical protein